MKRSVFIRSALSVALLGVSSAFAASSKPTALDEFRILHVAPYSGNLKSTGTWLRDALKAYAKDMEQGGFPRKIVIKEFDDGYVPDKTLEIANTQAKEFQPHAMFGMVGTANLKTMIDKKFFDTYDIPLIGVRTGAPLYHNKVVHLRASYASEVNNLMEFAALQGFSKVGVIYQNDDFGQDGLKAAQTYATSHPEVTLAAQAPYTRNTIEVGPAVKAMLDVNVKAVVIVGNTNAVAEITKQIKTSGQKIALFTVSVADPGQIVDKIKDQSQGLVVAQVVPSLYDSRFSIASEFRKFATRHNLPPNSTVFEGFVMAKVLFDGAARVKGQMSGSALLKEVRAKPVNYGGLRFNLPETQRTTTFVDSLIIGSKNESYY